MGAFEDMQAADSALFVDPDCAPSEEIIYRPFGGTPRTILATVVRTAPQDFGGATVRQVRIFVRRHATEGVTSVNVDGDEFTLAMRKGEAPSSGRRAKAVEAEFATGFHLLIQ